MKQEHFTFLLNACECFTDAAGTQHCVQPLHLQHGRILVISCDVCNLVTCFHKLLCPPPHLASAMNPEPQNLPTEHTISAWIFLLFHDSCTCCTEPCSHLDSPCCLLAFAHHGQVLPCRCHWIPDKPLRPPWLQLFCPHCLIFCVPCPQCGSSH